MNSKNRIIPNVSKEERVSFEYGYHNFPNWLLIVIFVVLALLFITVVFTNI